MMKTYIKTALVAILTLGVAGCDYLEPRVLSQVDEEAIYKNMSYITQNVTNAYSYLPSGFNSIGNSLLASATDEAEAVRNDVTIQKFNTGSWSKYSNPDDQWSTYYNGIRQCCEVRDGISGDIWEYLKYSNPAEYESRTKLMNQYLNEVRFLKAYYHYELLSRFAGIPIIDKKLDPNNPDDLYELQHTARNTFEECVDFIVGECDAVAPNLPTSYGDTDLGRVTRGAALALKSRVLLLAASDLYNQSGNTNAAVGYTSGAQSDRWLRAAKAAQEVIDLGLYSLHISYQELFLLATAKKDVKEVIWERRLPATRNMENNNYPIGYDIGQTETCPSQNLVDAYEMKDGTPFSWSNPAHQADPYTNRDPRLKMSILTNNEQWAGRKVEIWEGGQDGLPREYATKTGYYLKKFLNDNMNKNSQSVTRQWLYFRYAEVLLNYAEAANQYGGPDFKVDGASKPITPVEAINLIRKRTGVAMPDVATTFANRSLAVNKANLTDLILNERRVELAFEDFRWTDARRWLKGSEILGATLKGVKIQKTGDNEFAYSVFDVEQRVFNAQSMYLYPIPQTEVAKSNGKMLQNPNW